MIRRLLVCVKGHQTLGEAPKISKTACTTDRFSLRVQYFFHVTELNRQNLIDNGGHITLQIPREVTNLGDESLLEGMLCIGERII